MYLHLLETEEELNILLMLCFATGIADPNEMEEKGKQLFTRDLFGHVGLLSSMDDIAEDSKLLSTFGMQDKDVEFFEMLANRVEGRAHNLSVVSSFDASTAIRPFVEIADEFFAEMSGSTSDKAKKYPEIFKGFMQPIWQEEEIVFSVQKQKAMLFAMAMMAFQGGECSDSKRAVLQIAGEVFGFKSETIEEIIEKASGFTIIYDECLEMITA